MPFKNILITGGCGFVGSSLALKLKAAYPDMGISVLDNLSRKGSKLNVARLEERGIEVVRGNVQDLGSFAQFGGIDLIIDCAAEPSVMAGRDGSPVPVIESNLIGTINILELSRRTGAAVLFLSTSRVYPVAELNMIETLEGSTRFEIAAAQKIPGISPKGIAENFPLGIQRTLYGATKLASEMLLQEYRELYGTRFIINRCGVIAGPWQFGKIDQGVAVLWMARHVFEGKLSYIGFGGTGKQVRDFLHIEDLFEAIRWQLEHADQIWGSTFNIGGGHETSASLMELTSICQKLSGTVIEIGSEPETRWGDVKLYISDYSKFASHSGWKPRKSVEDIMRDIYVWISENRDLIRPILS